MCQCPKTGNSHFHEKYTRCIRRGKKSVNALRRATLISTKKEKLKACIFAMCQCPKTGNSHFHSVDKIRRKGCDNPCVNALRRATLISTKGMVDNSSSRTWLCQCPKTGNSHFHVDKTRLRKYLGTLCQCPKTGNSHFHWEDVTKYWD